uniref:Uncharacterized protein n=1 Tax=Arundo donax TaxID=35708 RepID=A0A0A9ETR8_ARUDO
MEQPCRYPDLSKRKNHLSITSKRSLGRAQSCKLCEIARLKNHR